MSDPDESSQPDGPKPLPGPVAFLGMGLSVAVCVGIGVGLGIWIDDQAQTAPLFLVIGLVLGVATAAMSVIKQIRAYL